MRDILVTGMQHAFSGVIGHAAQVAFLARVLERGTAAHAYAFSGPSGLGKRAVALRFAAALLSTSPDGLARHPDFLHLAPHAEDGYVIDDIREACERLSRTSLFGRHVALIEDAHTLRPEAQNALLKTLEEPAGNTVAILLADDAGRVLPTILSRAVHLPFTGVPREMVTNGLLAAGVPEPDARRLAEAADGKPGRAFALQSPEAWSTYTALRDEVRAFLALTPDMRLMKASTFAKRDETVDLDSWLGALAVELRARLPDERDPAPLRALLDAFVALRDSGNPVLALEHIALNIH